MTLWGGRFTQKMDSKAWELNASITFDYRMAKQDTQASISWANALEKIGILTESESRSIQSGLKQIQQEFSTKKFSIQPEDEDIHTAVERRLFEIIGPVAGKLHTGRSRNDQVATDFRLWMIENINDLLQAIKELQKQFLQRAERDFGIIMPSYTHLQRAQPILLSHWWLSFFWPLQRDLRQMKAAQKLASVMPLGSGAVAGSGFAIDRLELAGQLGFEEVSQNSIDAVSDRDFAAQFLFNAVLCSVHLAHLAEQIVIFTSTEFGFFTLSDAYSSGSSLMPQKKNADVFELTRGKSGTMLGVLCGFLASLKGLPSAYDKDLQEDKQAVFQVFDTLMSILPVIGNAIATLTVNEAKMEAALDASLFATDIADGLVKSGIPFREAYVMVGKAVKLALDQNISLDTLGDEDWQSFTQGANLDWKSYFSAQRSIETRFGVGGTAATSVKEQIEKIRKLVEMNLE